VLVVSIEASKSNPLESGLSNWNESRQKQITLSESYKQMKYLND
jgi:hypothetical protein